MFKTKYRTEIQVTKSGKIKYMLYGKKWYTGYRPVILSIDTVTNTAIFLCTESKEEAMYLESWANEEGIGRLLPFSYSFNGLK